MAENIPPQPGTRYQDIPNIMANLLKVVKKISNFRVRNQNGGLVLQQSSQHSSLGEEDEEARILNAQGARKTLETLLNALDAKALYSLLEYSHSGDSNGWDIAEDPTVIVIRTVLSGTTNDDIETSRAIERRHVIYTGVIDILNNGKILSSKATELCISILLSELDRGQHLWKKYPNFINAIIQNLSVNDSKANAFELLPAMWGRIILSTNDKIYDGLNGEEYSLSILNRLCKTSWGSKSVVNVTRSLRDIPELSSEHAIRLMRKISKQMLEMELQEIPPLVYQMLLFTSKYKTTVPYFWEGVSSYFESMDSDVTAANNASTSSSSITTTTNVTSGRNSIGQLRNIEGTVLLHFNFSIKQDQRLGDAFIKYLQTNNNLSLKSPFAAAIMMSIARIRRFQESIISSLYDYTYKSYVQTDMSKRRPWIKNFLNDDDASHHSIKDTLNNVVENGIMGWDHVIPSLLLLAFRCVECGASNPMLKSLDLNAVQTTVHLGAHILKSTFFRYPMARGEILETIATSICTKHSAILRYISLIKVLSDAYPNLVLEYMTMLKMMVECLGRLTGTGSANLVRAMRKLIVLKPELKDFIVLILRKSLFNRSIESRVAAVSGLLALFPALKFQRNIRDVSGCLKRALSQEVTVKEVLYNKCAGASSPPLENIIWRHLQRYLDPQLLAASDNSDNANATRPIKLDSCINANGERIEPIAHLIQACSRFNSNHILSCIRKLCITFSREDCEPEDFGLDKGSEFNGLSSVAQKNVQRALLLDECCKVMIDFIGRELERTYQNNNDTSGGSSSYSSTTTTTTTTTTPIASTSNSPLRVKHIEGIVRFRISLFKIAKTVFEKGKQSKKTGKKKKQKNPSSQKLGNPVNAMKLLIKCQSQNTNRGEWLWHLRSYLIGVVSDFLTQAQKDVVFMQKKSTLTNDDDFMKEILCMLRYAGPVVIKEFNIHRKNVKTDSDDDEEEEEEERKNLKKKAKNREIVAVKALHSFYNMLRIIDLLPETFNKIRQFAILLKATFSAKKSSSQEDEDDDDDDENSNSNEEEIVELDDTEIDEAITRGYTSIRHLASLGLRSGEVPIVLESVESILILIKYTEYNPQIKEWIQRTCNGESLHAKVKKNNRAITKLLQARHTIYVYDYINNNNNNNNSNKSMMDSTKALGQSILSVSRYFDGAELTQNEEAVNTVQMLQNSSVLSATKEILIEITKTLEDAEWGLSKLRSINASTFSKIDDDEIDDEEDDGNEAEETTKRMVTRRDELTRKLKCLFQLSADISISLRPMINVELDMFLKEKLLRLVIRFFKFVNSLTKFLNVMVKRNPSVFSDTNVVRGVRNLVTKVSGRENSLSKELYTQLTALHRHEEEEDSSDDDSRSKKKKKKSADELEAIKAKQVLRQSKIIPEVVYNVETFEASLLKLSKIKIDDRTIFKFDLAVARGTARDFRITGVSKSGSSDGGSTSSSSKRKRVKEESEEEEEEEEDDEEEEEEEEENNNNDDEEESDDDDDDDDNEETNQDDDRRKTMLVVSGEEDDDAEEDEDLDIESDDDALENSLE